MRTSKDGVTIRLRVTDGEPPLVEIGGVDITRSVVSIRIDADAKEPTRVWLQLIGTPIEAVADAAVAELAKPPK